MEAIVIKSFYDSEAAVTRTVGAVWSGTKARYDVINSKGAYLKKGVGISTQTVSAVTTVTIAHELGRVPSQVDVTPMSVTAAGSYHVTSDATNIMVTYPAAITGTWVMSWEVE